MDSVSPWPSQLHGDVAEELLKVTRRKTGLPEAHLETSAFMILWVLSDGRPRTLRELAEELDLEQSTVNRQVNNAIRHGYVERFDVDGCASKHIRPTPRGSAEFEHDGLLRAERLSAVFTNMPPGAAERLLEGLRAFNQAYETVLEKDKHRARKTSA